MRKEDREVKAPQTQVAGLKIVFASIFMGASLMLDLYAMINYSKLLWLIGILSLVFVASVYFFSSSVLQLKFSAQMESDELYNDLFKSSKATYLMMKKSFEEIEQQLIEIEEKAGIPQEEIINAQKSIAKISISRNKENTDALMNSNDRLLEKVFDFEDQLAKLEEKVVAGQKASTTEAIQDVLLKQQELSNLLKEVEIALKKDILSINSKIQSQPQPVVMASAPMPGPAYVQDAFAQPEVPVVDHSEIPNDVLDDLIAKAGEELDRQAAGVDEEVNQPGEVISLDQMVPDEEPLISEEPLMVEEPLVQEEPLVDEPGIQPDFLDEPVADLNDEIVADEPIMEVEPEISLEAGAIDELEIPVEPEIVAEPEIPIEPEVAAEPEIPLEPEVVAEPETPVEPEIPEEPAQEEKPPMPDLSDPNHVMTPDEIAALLANM
ncbi:MAG: hypothetical protein ACI4CC_06430 [Lachnospiraceae bacterium]